MSKRGYTQLGDEDPGGYGLAYQQPNSRPSTSQNGNESNLEKSRLLGEVQNVKSKNVYVFSDGTVADNEDETIELNQMTQRSGRTSQRSYKSTSASQYDDITIKEIPLEKTDTLQGLSIKFRCPIPELKRINGLYRDQDFHALTSIKIPVRSHQTILQQELDEVARQRITDSGEIISRSQRHGADIVSSETSDDEDRYNGRQSVLDIVELHSDSGDEESLALLDRKWAQQKHKTTNDSKKDKIKFDKLLSRKDDELRVLTEKVQRQADAVDEVTAVMRTSPGLMPPPRPQNCLSSMKLSMPCVCVSVIVLLVILPLLLIYYFEVVVTT